VLALGWPRHLDRKPAVSWADTSVKNQRHRTCSAARPCCAVSQGSSVRSTPGLADLWLVLTANSSGLLTVIGDPALRSSVANGIEVASAVTLVEIAGGGLLGLPGRQSPADSSLDLYRDILAGPLFPPYSICSTSAAVAQPSPDPWCWLLMSAGPGECWVLFIACAALAGGPHPRCGGAGWGGRFSPTIRARSGRLVCGGGEAAAWVSDERPWKLCSRAA